MTKGFCAAYIVTKRASACFFRHPSAGFPIPEVDTEAFVGSKGQLRVGAGRCPNNFAPHSCQCAFRVPTAAAAAAASNAGGGIAWL
eukprot:1155836-Pelagomonas_calceolata.AAC.4